MMNISDLFLDKKSAAIDAIRDYDNMTFIIEHTDETIRERHKAMCSVGTTKISGTPKAHNPNAGEERIIDAIDEMDILEERYRQALEYMAWFQPAWDRLSDDERLVLEAFYRQDDSYGNMTARKAADALHVNERTAYRRRDASLKKLSTLLFGRV